MEKDLSNYRKSYEKQELLENTIGDNPIDLFHNWFQELEANYTEGETNAMILSTIGLDGYPKSRVVLLKKFNHEGFIFYTNYDSEKGKAILANPNVCLSFFWHQEERQVIIKGKAEKLPEGQSTDYFESRPHGSQLGALASQQSEVIENREVLEEKLKNMENKYKGKSIPKPNNWGGYIVKPTEIEFWQGRANRLHDRIRYQLIDGSDWKRDRLAP